MRNAERLGPGQGLPPWVWAEHIARFEFAANMVHDQRVIECACGAGLGTRFLAEGGAVEIRAYDVSPDDVARARDAVSQPTVSFEVADGRALPCPDDWADIYVAFETIEHIENDLAFLQEAARVLRPGGLLLCSTPNRDVTNAGSRLTDSPKNPFHVREYSGREFASLLHGVFGSIEAHGQNPYSACRTRFLRAVAGATSPRTAASANSALKLPRYVHDSASAHRVESVDSRHVYEYMIAVCSNAVSDGPTK